MSHIDQMPEEKTPSALKIVLAGLIALICIIAITLAAGVPLPAQ